MIQIENTEIYGWDAAIRGMRNPKNSWDRSDSGNKVLNEEDVEFGYEPNIEYVIGENDLSLMKTLCKAGTDHRKFMRMLTVYVDITAPLYWLKEFDTYKVGTVANSCSTMHKIAAKEFTLDDFSHEHILVDFLPEKYECNGSHILEKTVECLNLMRKKYIETNNKDYWWQMIQLLPSSYNQKRTVMLNYEVLANMYKSRKNHKLDEWHTFCDWIETLPHSEIITGKFD